MAIKKCVNIDCLYTEIPFLDRFQAAKDDGFESIEFWSWPNRDLDAIKEAAEKAGIVIAGFNGYEDGGFSLVDPDDMEDYLEFLKKSIAAAKKIGSLSLTIHSNALGEGGIVANHYDNLSDTVKLCSMYRTLVEAAKLAEENEIQLNLEILNVHVDHVGNFLKSTQMAAEVIRLIGSPNLRVLYDIYHMQINEGRVCDTIAEYLDAIGHFHIADVPGRHEPGTGELNYPNIIKKLEELGYDGRVGAELFPAKDTETAVKAILSIF